MALVLVRSLHQEKITQALALSLHQSPRMALALALSQLIQAMAAAAQALVIVHNISPLSLFPLNLETD